MLKRRIHGVLKLCYLALTVVLCAVSFPVCAEAEKPFPAVVYGCMFMTLIHASVTMLTVEYVWGTQKFLWRLTKFVGWWILGSAAWLAPFLAWRKIPLSDTDYVYLTTTFLLAPYLLIVSHSVFWVLRYFLRCRVVHVSSEVSGLEKWKITDIWIGTAIVAVASVGIRTALVGGTLNSATLSELVSSGLTFLLLHALVIMPAAIYILRPQSSFLAWFFCVVHFLIAGGLAAWAAIAAGGWQLQEPAAMATVAFSICFVGPVLGCFMLRFSGYHLLWRSETQDVKTQPIGTRSHRDSDGHYKMENPEGHLLD